MEPFLRQVAFHYMSREGSISRSCFIFPNRRSKVFFMKYLGEAVKQSGTPVVAPGTITINDFFVRVSGSRSADRVDLLLKLHECYKALFKSPEPLDEFVFWGDVILGDFDDVDKYLVDARGLFTNVADFKDIQDTYSYLTPAQREAIDSFLSHFRHEGKLTVRLDPDSPNVKEKFLQVWNILYPLYCSFRERLASEGVAYEGMIYRGLAERVREEAVVDVLADSFPDVDRFVFVGLNALNECEKTVMRKMRDAGIAEFCWDYSSRFVKDPDNKSSFFMERNVSEFRPPFKLDPDGLQEPEVEVISVPSSVGQAKLLPALLKDSDHAVVIPDETLLIPVLNSIPEHIKDINVTMGFPMMDSAFFDFMNLVSAMQMHTRCKDGKWFFYHSQVWSLFSSSIFSRLVAEDAEARETVNAVRKGKKYYIPEDELRGSALMDMLFIPALKDPKSTESSQIQELATYQKTLIKGLAPLMAKDTQLAMELEFAKAAYNAITSLQSKNLAILPSTYFKLLDQLLGPVAVPFNGEPLKGLQIMGPLETRALDFRNLVILSCNEGMFPRRSVSSSFIPPELRKGFSLPTYEYQDAVWAYYFYRLIQRAEKVTLVYDSRTEGLKNGEESRYIKQLEYHFGLHLKRSFVRAEAMEGNAARDIPKTEEDVARIRSANLSASAIKNYLDCPARFYYYTVKGLRKKNEVSEDLDSGMLGDVFHKTMESIYSRPVVTAEYLKSVIGDRAAVKAKVRKLILEQLHSLEVTGRDLVVEDVIVEYVMKTVQRDIELLGKSGSKGFEMLALEGEYTCDFEGFHLKGIIDRMDSLRPGETRIVDYKTGKVEDSEMAITDGNAMQVVEDLFGEKNDGRPKIAFQLFLYDFIARRQPGFNGDRLVNAIYPPANLFTDRIKEIPVSEVFMEEVEKKFRELLAEMVSLEIPFRRTTEEKTCSYCDFRMICGR